MYAPEFGKEHEDVIILLHGGGLSWWNYRDEAELLRDRYRVVLPVLDGHAGSDRPFTTIEDNAAELLGYIDERFGGSVAAIGGLSLGAQVLVEMLSERADVCRAAVIESALVIPMKLTNRLIAGSVSMSYGLIEKPWFAKLQFGALNMKESYYDDYYRDSAVISKSDIIAFMRANSSYSLKDSLTRAQVKASVVVGGREQKKLLDSAGLIHAAIGGSELTVLDGYTHGELSLDRPEEYVSRLEALLG